MVSFRCRVWGRGNCAWSREIHREKIKDELRDLMGVRMRQVHHTRDSHNIVRPFLLLNEMGNLL